MRLIDADKIVEEINKHGLEVLSKGGNALELGGYATGLLEAMDIIKSSETIDPVKRGYWNLRHIGAGHYWECSVCHTNPCIYVTKDTKYCPNCGAKMDQEEDANHDH